MNNTPLPQDVVRMIEAKIKKLYNDGFINNEQYIFRAGATWALTNEPLLNAAGWVRKEEVDKEYIRIDDASDIKEMADRDYDSQKAFEYAEFAKQNGWNISHIKPGHWYKPVRGSDKGDEYMSHNEMWEKFEKSRVIPKAQNKQP